MLNIVSNGTYKYGLVNQLEARAIPRGAASSSLNWLTRGDHIELRPGQVFMGNTSVQTGIGRATGLKKCTQANGVEILFGTYGKKLKYFNETTEEWVENGSDLLGSAVVDSNGLGFEPISMSEYVGLAGNQMFLNSPNCSGYYKIMVSNPGSSIDLYDAARNFKGHIKIDTNRTLLWGRVKDQTGVYGSYIDTQNYTTVTAESVGTGDGSTVTFNHTLAAVASHRTFFGLTVTAGAIVLTDTYSGTLIASDGSTGTINYETGALSITFATAPANSEAITTTYQWEDSNSTGISDFTKSSPRSAGQGFVFRQDEGGGALQNINQYNQVYYCMHLKKTWVLNITSTDTNATNLPYRQRVGIPNPRASVETGEGIYYVDDTDLNDISVRLLTYELGGSQQVIPVARSNNINLNDYRFDQAASTQFGELILFSCAEKNSTQSVNGKTISLNNRVLVYNTLWKSWDILDYGVTCFEVYNGALIGGDSYSNNFIKLFSGLDDFDTDGIPNFWNGRMDNLDIEGLKKSKKIYLQGLIGIDQKLKVSVSLDNGPFVEVGGSDAIVDGVTVHTYAIEGDGDYVDRSQPVTIGSLIIGNGEIGGGGDGITAFNFERVFDLNSDKFEFITIRFEAMSNGYCSVSTHKWWDVRLKGRKVPSQYRG